MNFVSPYFLALKIRITLHPAKMAPRQKMLTSKECMKFVNMLERDKIPFIDGLMIIYVIYPTPTRCIDVQVFSVL